MKWVFMMMALLLVSMPAHAQMSAKTVICEGCGDGEYGQVALDAAGFMGVVLVVDAKNGQLRKFVVTSHENEDGGPFVRTAYRIPPTGQEWDTFIGAIGIGDRLVSNLEACGPGLIGDLLIPDLGFEFACEQHDLCYLQGGNDDDRRDCDRQFYYDLRALGATLGLAATYYLAVRTHGWRYFSYRNNNGWSSTNPLFGCNFLIVCDYTSMVQQPG